MIQPGKNEDVNHFIKYNSGITEYASEVIYGISQHLQPTLTLEGKNIRMDSVVAFKCASGYYMRNDVSESLAGFCKLINYGTRIDTYSQEFITFSRSLDNFELESSRPKMKNYYQKDSRPLKALNYDNLMLDLEDNEASMNELLQYKRI